MSVPNDKNRGRLEVKPRIKRLRKDGNMYDVFLGSSLVGWVINSAQGGWFHNRNGDEFKTRKQAVEALLKVK